jgi:hypothetical protein
MFHITMLLLSTAQFEHSFHCHFTLYNYIRSHVAIVTSLPPQHDLCARAGGGK